MRQEVAVAGDSSDFDSLAGYETFRRGMNRFVRTELRVLAIDPISRGFGFAVLEGPERLIDWGVAHVRGEDTQANCLKRIAALIQLYTPDLVVVENWSKPGGRRKERARRLIQGIVLLASEQGKRVRKVSRKEVLKVFCEAGVTTKYEIAGAITSVFPELDSRMPRRRKPWTSEDHRMCIFDAVAMAVTFHYRRSALNRSRIV